MRIFSLFVFIYLAVTVTVTTVRGQEDPADVLLRTAGAPAALNSCYSIDGRGNNVDHPQWGASGDILEQYEGNDFVGGNWTQPARERFNARTLSNIFAKDTCTSPLESCLNDWFWVWAQLIDHDVALIPEDASFGVMTTPLEQMEATLKESIKIKRSKVRKVALADRKAAGVENMTEENAVQVRTYVNTYRYR
jgi:hypothetical protein